MASRFESHPGERCVSLTSHQYFSQGLYPIPTSKSDNKGQANSRSVAAYNTFLGPLSRWNKAEAEETFSIRPATNVSRRASHQRAHAWSLSLFLSFFPVIGFSRSWWDVCRGLWGVCARPGRTPRRRRAESSRAESPRLAARVRVSFLSALAGAAA